MESSPVQDAITLTEVPVRECAVCKKREGELMRCGKCLAVSYCSGECQRSDWKEHKTTCKKPEEKSAAAPVVVIPPSKPAEDAPKKASVEDFTFISKAGDGNFSEIFLVERNSNKQRLAMKQVSKQRLKQLHKENDVLMEKHCLTKLKGSQYIVQLHDTFQDDKSLFLTMDHVSGGELWEVVKVFGLPCQSLVKHYFGQMVAALEYMHGLGVVHRDIKPENVLLDENNQIKIIDFGTARDMFDSTIKPSGNSHRGRKVYEHFVGTPQYMPSEAIHNKGSDGKTDIWALGCMVYQFCTGFTPFMGGSEFLVFNQSLNAEPLFYPDMVPADLEDLIKKILVKDTAKRASMDEIKQHKYFEGYDFKNIATYKEVATQVTAEEKYIYDARNEITKAQKCTDAEIKEFIARKRKEVEENGSFGEASKKVLNNRLTFLERQLRHYYETLTFEHDNQLTME